MNSDVARRMDGVFDFLQWAGEEYLLEELDDEVGGLPRAGASWGREPMYWTGYLYRLWHCLTGEEPRVAPSTATADARHHGRRLPRQCTCSIPNWPSRT